VKYDTSGGTLKIIVPSGKDMFGENRTAPHMMQAIEGDFQIETRVKFDPKDDYQGAGLFVYKDSENYLRLERAFGGTGGSGSGIRFDARTNEDYKPITTPDQTATAAKTVDLKLVRMGKKFIAFWRLDEESEWKEVGEFDSDYPDTVQVGIIACSTGTEIPVEFSYVKLAPQV
jgi:regulation of enolase protein 1 (concanavalin A-like superfamily)